MNVLNQIKELANLKQVSLAEIERQTGLSVGSISKWGKSSPSIDKLQKVADYFDVSIDSLVGKSDEEERVIKIEKALNSTMSYDGKPVSEADKAVLRGIIAAYFENKGE